MTEQAKGIWIYENRYNNTFNVTFLSAAVLCLNSTKTTTLKNAP